MKDSTDSQRPRRWWSVGLAGLAAATFLATGPRSTAWPSSVQLAVLASAAFGWLALYLLLLPTAVIHDATLRLRHRLRYRLRYRLRRRQAAGRHAAQAVDQAEVDERRSDPASNAAAAAVSEAEGDSAGDPAGDSEVAADEPLVRRTHATDLAAHAAVTLALATAAYTTIEWLLRLWSTAPDQLVAVPLRVVVMAGGIVLLVMLIAALAMGPRLARLEAERRPRAWAESVVLGGAVLLGPVLAWLDGLVRWLAPDESSGRSERSARHEVLADAIEAGSHQGDLSLVQSELLRRELDFVRTTAAEVMVPRVEVTYLDLDMTLAQARTCIAATHHSRFPVQQGSVDNVVAVLHAKEFLRWRNGDAPETMRKLLSLLRPRPPVHVGQDEPLDQVLERLKRERVSMAVVDDAYGGVAGILTVEDVVEELVGEIVDEVDVETHVETVHASGRRRLAELAEQGLRLPGEPEQSLAEFVLAQLTAADAHTTADRSADRSADGSVVGRSLTIGEVRLTVEAVDGDGNLETVRVDYTAGAAPSAGSPPTLNAAAAPVIGRGGDGDAG